MYITCVLYVPRSIHVLSKVRCFSYIIFQDRFSPLDSRGSPTKIRTSRPPRYVHMQSCITLSTEFSSKVLHCQSRFSSANIPNLLKKSDFFSKLVYLECGNIPAYVVVHLKVVHLNIIEGGHFSENLTFLKITYVWAITLKKGVVHLTR